MTMQNSSRQLRNLTSVGPAILRDFERLGVKTVAQLAREEPKELYKRLCRITGERQDMCVLDVFSTAVAQARDPELPLAMRWWWYWSRERKRATAGQRLSQAPSQQRTATL
jgi:hypothetical protein